MYYLLFHIFMALLVLFIFIQLFYKANKDALCNISKEDLNFILFCSLFYPIGFIYLLVLFGFFIYILLIKKFFAYRNVWYFLAKDRKWFWKI